MRLTTKWFLPTSSTSLSATAHYSYPIWEQLNCSSKKIMCHCSPSCYFLDFTITPRSIYKILRWFLSYWHLWNLSLWNHQWICCSFLLYWEYLKVMMSFWYLLFQLLASNSVINKSLFSLFFFQRKLYLRCPSSKQSKTVNN